MARKHVGGLFSQLRAKDPDSARALEKLAEGLDASTHQNKSPVTGKPKPGLKQAGKSLVKKLARGRKVTPRAASLLSHLNHAQIRQLFRQSSDLAAKAAILGKVEAEFQQIAREGRPKGQKRRRYNELIAIKNELAGELNRLDLRARREQTLGGRQGSHALDFLEGSKTTNTTASLARPEHQGRAAGRARNEPSPKPVPTGPAAGATSPPAGCATQFSRVTSTQICDVVVGFDFGTSCSKVVLHTPYVYGQAFALPFGELAHQTNQYLLPTGVWLNRDGVFSVERQQSAELFQDIKINLLRSAGSYPGSGQPTSLGPHPQEAAAAYLALALRLVRGWFLQNQEKAYSSYELRWSLNVGVPAARFDETGAHRAYSDVARVAWAVSTQAVPITLSSIRGTLDQLYGGAVLKLDDLADLNVVPEVAAEVAGYARSDVRREGLHLMVDVGAATFDACGFVLRESDGVDRYSILSASVDGYGVNALHDFRCGEVTAEVKRQLERLRPAEDQISPIDGSLESYLPELKALRERLARDDDQYCDLCYRRVIQLSDTLRRRRDPHSGVWRTAMPVFLCGGGSRISVYEQVINRYSEWLQTHLHNDGARLIRLPKPRNLTADLPDEEYHRLAVAWGLSQPAYDIGTFFGPSQIEDVREEKEPEPWWRQEGPFVSKDMV